MAGTTTTKSKWSRNAEDEAFLRLFVIAAALHFRQTDRDGRLPLGPIA